MRNIMKMLSYTYTLLKPDKGPPIRLFHCLSYFFHSHFTENWCQKLISVVIFSMCHTHIWNLYLQYISHTYDQCCQAHGLETQRSWCKYCAKLSLICKSVCNERSVLSINYTLLRIQTSTDVTLCCWMSSSQWLKISFYCHLHGWAVDFCPWRYRQPLTQ